MKILLLVLSLACCFITIPVRANITSDYVLGANHVRIHYLHAGPMHASHSILFIPGHDVSALIWSHQLNYFGTRGYQVVAIDARSQGESSLAQTNAPEDRARDIYAVIHNLKLTHLTLVGWSQGVQDVAAYVQQFGTYGLRRIVLVDSTVSMGPDAVKENPAFVETVLKGIAAYSRHPGAYCNGMLHAIISAPTPMETFRRLKAECLKTPPDVSISMLIQDLFTIDLRPSLKKFIVPTLVVASAQSFELNAERQMAATLPHGKFVVVKHAAHAVFFDQPREFNHLLKRFIEARPVSG